MSENEGKPAAVVSGISQASHDAAVAAARAEGHAAGTAEATERLSAVLGADGIKGDGKRMAAALDLATKSPAMAGADVTAFVAGNVSAAAAGEQSATAYEASRLSAAGLAAPSAAPKAKASINRGDIFSARRQVGKN